jgi:hypothetical protein
MYAGAAVRREVVCSLGDAAGLDDLGAPTVAPVELRFVDRVKTCRGSLKLVWLSVERGESSPYERRTMRPPPAKLGGGTSDPYVENTAESN